MPTSDMDHMTHLRAVADEDIRHLEEKERTYRGSWKKRGGVGAFMMLARKWDRLEGMMEKPHEYQPRYDILAAMEYEKDFGGDDGTVLAEIRDLRRYLLLVEAEMVARGVVEYKPTVTMSKLGPVPVHAVGDPPRTEEAARAVVEARYPENHPVRFSGANGMKLGDKIVYTPGNRAMPREGIAGVLSVDGDVEVFFPDTWSWSLVSVKYCRPAVPSPVPVENSNRHADRYRRPHLTRFEYNQLPVGEEREAYEWDETRGDWKLRPDA